MCRSSPGSRDRAPQLPEQLLPRLPHQPPTHPAVFRDSGNRVVPQHRFDIQAGPADLDRQPARPANIRKGRKKIPLVSPQRIYLVRIGNVDDDRKASRPASITHSASPCRSRSPSPGLHRRESADRISPAEHAASRTPSRVLPQAVGPQMTRQLTAGIRHHRRPSRGSRAASTSSAICSANSSIDPNFFSSRRNLPNSTSIHRP